MAECDEFADNTSRINTDYLVYILRPEHSADTVLIHHGHRWDVGHIVRMKRGTRSRGFYGKWCVRTCSGLTVRRLHLWTSRNTSKREKYGKACPILLMRPSTERTSRGECNHDPNLRLG